MSAVVKLHAGVVGGARVNFERRQDGLEDETERQEVERTAKIKELSG